MLSEKPLLLIKLRKHLPKDIKLSTLLEVLGSLMGPGVSEFDIDEHLSAPAIQWQGLIYKNQSSAVDPISANHRADTEKLGELFKKMTKANDITLLKEMLTLSVELGDMEDVLYKHDGY